jgi:hypothetical protein
MIFGILLVVIIYIALGSLAGASIGNRLGGGGR